ncbi:hypothetical protein PR202_gb28016 [Eleusine coracana subsp. coracana]|uniref:ER membrane protein complex subunit 7 beta-sandwich domain-containing protein n=1 Tax=Eleusine coracana subsp. coracana TaxID=191504 RepID=A0AAV5FWS8_ELECO|nr:hypothetical protein PR202_gb28016 [Eleusine coracana subsp. coracana]
MAALSGEGYTIAGRIKIEGKSPTPLTYRLQVQWEFFNNVSNVVLVVVLRSHNVPAGTHLIEVRVDISARNPGYIQAALTETRRVLNELVLEPLKEEQYYEIREHFSIMSLLKSPMGLMVGFMVIMVFVMPKMMENIGKLHSFYIQE